MDHLEYLYNERYTIINEMFKSYTRFKEALKAKYSNPNKKEKATLVIIKLIQTGLTIGYTIKFKELVYIIR